MIAAALACSAEPDREGILSDARLALAQLPPPTEQVRPWATAVTQLVPYLSDSDLHAVAGTALGLAHRLAFRNEILAALLPYLPEPDLSIARDAVITALRQAGGSGDRRILAAVLRHLPDTTRTQLIDEIIQREEWADDVWVLCSLAQYLPEHMLAKAVDAACAMRPESWRAAALEELAPVLPPDLLKRALRALRASIHQKTEHLPLSPSHRCSPTGSLPLR